MGEKLWDKLEGSGEGNWGEEVVSTLDGSILLVHQIQNPITGGTDYILKKLNSSGSIIWERKYGGNRSEFPIDLKSAIDRGFILVGDEEGDIFVLKTNSFGLVSN